MSCGLKSYIAFILFLLFSSALDMPARAAARAPVPKTGLTSCFDAIGTIISCAGTGQDGGTLTGVAWPEPRFVDNGDQTVADKLTGLVWTRDADPAGGYKTWRQALDYIKTLNNRKYLGHDDWRLPNVNEMESLVNKRADLALWLNAQGFINVRADYYYTSTTYASYASYAWSVGMYSGIIAGHSKADGGYVWPVRTGEPSALPVPKTGQTSCYDNSGKAIECVSTGQDGELRAGADWPSPRFRDNGDQSVTDTLTGLVWSGDGNAPGPAACNPGKNKTWQGALEYIKCLNTSRYLGKSDWRLPNRNEMASLMNREQANSAAWLNAKGFSNVKKLSYWTSSTYAYTTWNAWSINMHDGTVTSTAKKHDIAVWPVRGGQ